MTALDFDKLIEGEDIFGLDISSTRVKVMWISSSGKNQLKLRGFGEESIPASAVVGGIIRRPEIVATAIKTAITKANPKAIGSKYAVCGIPQEKIFLKIEDFPNLEKEKLREAVNWKAKTVLAMPLENIYWDWHRLNPVETLSTVSIQFAAVEKEVVDSYVSAINAAGLIPLAFEMECSAAARTILASYDPEEKSPLLLVDIGNSNSNLSIYHDGGFRFNSSVKIGGNQITKIVGTEKKLSPSESENYKRVKGFSTKTESLRISLETSLLPLVTEIKNAVHFYDKTPEKTDDIKDVLIYGDGAVLKGLDKYLGDNLPDLKVKYANPSLRMVPIPQFISHEKIFPHLVVSGLSLRNSTNYSKFKDINFLPPSVQNTYVSDQLKKKVSTITKVFAINVIALSGFMLGGWFLINVNLDQINDTIADKTSLLQSNRIQALSSEVSDYNKSLESINAISNSEFNWLKIYEKITEATPSSVTLKSLDIYLNENLASTKPPTWIITIVGVTNDRQTVIDYSDNLAKTEIFDEVNVPVSALSSSEDVDFQINMELTFNNLLKDPTKFKKVGAVSEIVFD